jgi:hypothetical protein
MNNNTKVSDVFNFSRFGKYLVYDLKNAWSSYGVAIITLASIPLIIFVAHILFDNLWSDQWTAPSLSTRMVLFGLSSIVMAITVPSKLYGNLTSKKEGTAYLMVPSSTLEKFVSMLIVCLIALPVAYFGVYFIEDWLLSVFDPSMTGTVFSTVHEGLLGPGASNVAMGADEWSISMMGKGIPAMYMSIAVTLMIFLLGALCFKKWKIVGTIAVLFALSVLLTLILATMVNNGFDGSAIEEYLMANIDRIDKIFNLWSIIINTIVVVGLGTGIFFRLKSLKL